MLCQSAPDTTQVDPSIYIDGTLLKSADSFNYFGSIISNDGSLDKKTTYRISKEGQDLGRLPSKVLGEQNIKLFTKGKVYKAVVLTSILRGCETWTLYQKHSKQLENVHMQSLPHASSFLAFDGRHYYQPNSPERADCNSINPILLKAQLSCTGHVIRKL